MKEALDEVLAQMQQIRNSEIANVKFENGRLSFEFGGGRFFFLKSVSPDLETGYLTLYHETPFEDDRHWIEVKDFIIKITKYRHDLNIKIKNHLDSFDNNLHRISTDKDGFFDISINRLISILDSQLSAKLVKDEFRIYVM